MPVSFTVKYYLYRLTFQNFKLFWLFGHYLHRCSDACVFHYNSLLRQWLVKTGLQQCHYLFTFLYLTCSLQYDVFVSVQYMYGNAVYS